MLKISNQLAYSLIKLLVISTLLNSCQNKINSEHLNKDRNLQGLRKEKERFNDYSARFSNLLPIPKNLEVVFIEKIIQRETSDKEIFFIQIIDKDPSSELLAFFNSQRLPVKKGSEFKSQEGSLIVIKGMKKTAPHLLEIIITKGKGHLESIDKVYIFQANNEKWDLIKVETLSIS